MLGEADRPLTRLVELPGRGTTRVWECAGPPGAGTLMLIHGVAGTAELNWGKVFAPLGRHFRVVAADLRGHGDGIPLRSRFRLEDCADDVAALAGVLNIRRFAAVGYSMGGMVAQLLYRRHASLLSGLVLCSTAANARGSTGGADGRARGTGDGRRPAMEPDAASDGRRRSSAWRCWAGLTTRRQPGGPAPS